MTSCNPWHLYLGESSAHLKKFLLNKLQNGSFELCLLDNVTSNLIVFSGTPKKTEIITSPEDALILLDRITIKVKRRLDLFQKCRTNSVNEYQSYTNLKLPYLLIVFQDFLWTQSNLQQIEMILDKGKKVGIYLTAVRDKQGCCPYELKIRYANLRK